jgi:hypothetical protein
MEIQMAMEKRPAEVFGHPADVDSSSAKEHRARYWCPFLDKPCDKKSRLIDYPMGVCSVQYGEDVIALCPSRFLQARTILYDIADHYFGSHHDLLVFNEVSVPKAGHLGRFDYVMVKHRPLNNEIEDFVIIELQTGQTTSTGALVQALEDFTQGKEISDMSYGFGMNLADIWKRTFTQILTKGIALERWDHKIYWVVQKPVYQNFLDRYQLYGMSYAPSHNTIFAIYDLKRSGKQYTLHQTQIESSTIDDLFKAFRSNLEVPPKDAFVNKLQKIVEQTGDNVRLEVQLKSP